jgi:hypothetical protein
VIIKKRREDKSFICWLGFRDGDMFITGAATKRFRKGVH